ncbi:uncharacterized protein YbjQ (UPF0145 family) [Algoriphagus boseongensis]|uniref:Uncharacterized protein YbjQ (UPF0145 family) n=1 Tax=Algoriphagus boseongensis TaxID=1442587 RepID=A0A4R6T687_9BACT|nr:heavy metal-binding domain-containing protein [Algoriphagus boseongensis]TDQ17549.1 uncharacterized protein YbjQ (UPF0145 family) [Algoriphagus boseongensis]
MSLHCKNCNHQIKTGFLKGKGEITGNPVAFIHAFTNNRAESYCSNCIDDQLLQAKSNFEKELKSTKDLLEKGFSNLPILSIHQPLHWDYEVVGMVTSQSVIGTGLVSEITASWTDFFGKESNTFNDKIKKGEENCMNQLRTKALLMGAHAIIGTDIDYSEVGSGKGMLMVCMAGTAIKIKNAKEINYDLEGYSKLSQAKERLEVLAKIDVDKETLYHFVS